MIWNGLAIGTRNNYNSSINKYTSFCRGMGVSPWPVKLHILLEFCCMSVHGLPLLNLNAVAPSTIRGYISALRSYHVHHNLPLDVFDNELLHLTLRGISNCFQKPTRNRLPLGQDILRKILAVKVANPSGVYHRNYLNFSCAIIVAYAGFLRLGEITYDKRDLLNFPNFKHRHVLRSDVQFWSDHATLHLRHTKTDRDNKGVYIRLPRTDNDFCPVAALRRLFSEDPQPHDAPLFRFIQQGFPRQTLVQWIRTYLELAGESKAGYSGHSIRRGATQDAHEMGIPTDDIMALGRWTSDAVYRYFNYSGERQLKLRRQVLTRQLLSKRPRFDV